MVLMMEILIVLVAFGASLLTFFAGFGLGTLLLPVFALFFPPETAVAMTAIVHLLNNFFKISLIGNHVDKSVFIKFGLPAIGASFFGAFLLTKLAISKTVLADYELFGGNFQITPLNLTIGSLMFLFAILELFSLVKKWQVEKNGLFIGGILSGFFGGLSGHQGALRSAFLVKANLSKEAFIATGVAVSCFVDVIRIFIYSQRFALDKWMGNWHLLALAVGSAFAGAIVGKKLLTKTKVEKLYLFVAIALIIFGVLMAAGILAK